MIGVVGSAALGAPSLLDGGTLSTVTVQVIGVIGVFAWTAVTSFLMFGVLKAAGILRMHSEADEVGIDAYEHGASLWPNVLPLGEPSTDVGGD